MNHTKDWIKCPICESKTRVQIRPDTVLENFPLYCPKCKKETLICVKQMAVKISHLPKDDHNSYQ